MLQQENEKLKNYRIYSQKKKQENMQKLQQKYLVEMKQKQRLNVMHIYQAKCMKSLEKLVVTPINKNKFVIKLKANPLGFKFGTMRNLNMVTIKKQKVQLMK